MFAVNSIIKSVNWQIVGQSEICHIAGTPNYDSISPCQICRVVYILDMIWCFITRPHKHWGQPLEATVVKMAPTRRSLREVFACSRLFATTDLSQIYNREAHRHGTPCTKTTDSYLFSFLYNNPRKIRRETTVGKFVPNNGRRYLNWVTTVAWCTTTVASVAEKPWDYLA